MKVAIEDVELTLQQTKVDSATITAVVAALEQLVEENKVPGTAAKSKYRHGIILSDPNGELNGKEFAGWVVKMGEEKDMTQAVVKIIAAAKEYNCNSRKGKKNPIKTIGEACQNVAAKFFKAQEIKVVTKEPAMVLITNNQI